MMTARLDYCNSLLQGTSQYNIAKLQQVQNRCARVVLCPPWKTPSKSLLATGNALIPGATSHNIYKVSLLVFKSSQNKKPVYLHSLLSVDSLRTRLKEHFLLTSIGQISIWQQPCKLSGIPHLKSWQIDLENSPCSFTQSRYL